MKVFEWICRFPGHIVRILPESSLEQAVDKMLSGACVQDIYVVSDEDLVLGHLSHGRLVSLLLAEHRPMHARRQIMERVVVGAADELMESEFVFALPDEDLGDVLHRFIEYGLQDMPVLDEQRVLVGGINLNSVLRQMRTKPDLIF